MAVAALITWVITAGFGFFMLGTWIGNGGAKGSAGAASNFQPPVVFGHFLLAAGGLVVWIIYVINDSTALAWIAFVDLVIVAGIGDLLVVRWFKDRRTGGQSVAAQSAGTETATTQTPVALAEQKIPTPAVVLHGIFAVSTVVLVLLSALEVGS